MSKFLKIGFIVIALTFAFGSFANAQGTNEILKRMDIYYNSRQSLQANVAMEKRNPQLNETDVSEGKVWYVPAKPKQAMAFRLDWSKPLEENLLVINGLYSLYRRRLNTEYQGKVDKAKNNRFLNEKN